MLFPGFLAHKLFSSSIPFAYSFLFPFSNTPISLILIKYLASLSPSAITLIAQGCECCHCKDETTENNIFCGLVCGTSKLIHLVMFSNFPMTIIWLLTQVPDWVQSWNKLSTSDCCSQRGLGSGAQVFYFYLLLLTISVSINFLLLILNAMGTK